jgi:hypothetical protein
LSEDLTWNPELKCALEKFSISKFLDHCDEWEKEWLWQPDNSFEDKFLNYLEGIVSNPWRKIEYKVQLLILIRDNLTFITIIPCVIWNTPHLPSAIPPVERNLPSSGLFGLSSWNPSHRYRGLLRLRGGMDYVPLYLGSTPKR